LETVILQETSEQTNWPELWGLWTDEQIHKKELKTSVHLNESDLPTHAQESSLGW